MKLNGYEDVTAKGELGARCALLSARLEAPIYRPDVIFGIESAGWPGDWEGRTVLALTCLCKATGREPSYLDEIVSLLPSHLNGSGYLGPVRDKLDEQQLSGHSWLLRGLCEYYEYRKEEYVLDLIDGIVRCLFFQAIGKYETYPVTPDKRGGGDMSGNIASETDDWYLSTDTGCAYIPLDGLTHAYGVLSEYSPDRSRDEALAGLIDGMIKLFVKIPFLKIKLQTHATLTACRGILRRYSQTGDKDLLYEVKRIFGIYTEHGMTPTYANENWFGRPEWTEPCAIIDSFIVASQLYAYTEDTEYASLSQLILYNGVYQGQRNNGGFGCDTCAGDGILSQHCPEAYWCCTMRGGEGLAAAAAYSVTPEGVIVNPVSGVYTVNGRKLTVVSDYPHGSKATLRLEGGGKLYLVFLPWLKRVKSDALKTCDGYYIHIDMPDDEPVEFEIECDIRHDEAGGGSRVYDGPLMLGCADTDAEIYTDDVMKKDGKYICGGHELVTLDRAYLRGAKPLRVIFKSREPI